MAFAAFYLARLIDAKSGRILGSDEIWVTDPADPDCAPEKVAVDAAAFFNSDDHGLNPGGNIVHLFGPFAVAEPAHAFTVEDIDEDAEPDAEDFWRVAPVQA